MTDTATKTGKRIVYFRVCTEDQDTARQQRRRRQPIESSRSSEAARASRDGQPSKTHWPMCVRATRSSFGASTA